jgi:hypothetical protein
MNLVRIIDFLRDRLKTVLRVCYGILGALVLLDAIPAIVDKEHAHTWVEGHVPGFWAAFGFIGCAVLILVSKWFGHRGIMQREDYYDE